MNHLCSKVHFCLINCKLKPPYKNKCSQRLTVPKIINTIPHSYSRSVIGTLRIFIKTFTVVNKHFIPSLCYCSPYLSIKHTSVFYPKLFVSVDHHMKIKEKKVIHRCGFKTCFPGQLTNGAQNMLPIYGPRKAMRDLEELQIGYKKKMVFFHLSKLTKKSSSSALISFTKVKKRVAEDRQASYSRYNHDLCE